MDTIVSAGPGGFLHQQQGQAGPVWTKYSGGDTPMPNASTCGARGTGSDVVVDSCGGSSYTLQDMDTGTTVTLTVPTGDHYLGTFGSRVVSATVVNGLVGSLHILSSVAGQQAQTTATGWPSGAKIIPGPLGSDANSLLFSYQDSTGYGLALVDLGTGQVTTVFDGLASRVYRAVLTDQYIGWYDQSSLHLVPRSNPGAAATTLSIPAPSIPNTQLVRVSQLVIVGSTVLINYAVTYQGTPPPDSVLGGPLYQMPLAGGPLSLLLDHVNNASPLQTPGGALALGGSSASDWAMHRFTAASDGTVTSTQVYAEPQAVFAVDGLAMAGGQLSYIFGIDTRGEELWDRSVQWGGSAPSYGTAMSMGAPSVATDCSVQATCASPIANGDGGISQLARFGPASYDVVLVQGPKAYAVATGVTGGSLVDSDGSYVVYNGGDGRQYIGSDTLPNMNGNVIWIRPGGAAALTGGSYMWAADSTPGSISLIDLQHYQTQQTIQTDAPCVPTELQTAAERWVYWSCGPTGPAGVFDLATRQDISVPSGLAQLGDGYLVRHDTTAGKLVLTDFHTDTAVTTDLADLPAGAVADDRRATWAVDKSGGGIAYVDTQNNIHLVDPHIPASAPPPTAIGASLRAGEQLTAGHGITNSSMTLVMQSDGNLVAYLNTGAYPHGPAVWASGTGGHPGAYVLLQPDGNLVIYKPGGGPSTGGALWASGTWGHPGAYATLQDDGNFVVYGSAGGPSTGGALWADNVYDHSQTIGSGQRLTPGWWTQAKYTRLVMQLDGNLVIYRNSDGKAIWASNTWGHGGAYAYMQSDGNLVVYTSGGGPSRGGALWATGTWGHSGAYSVTQDDGNFVVYRSGGGPSSGGALWATGTNRDVP